MNYYKHKNEKLPLFTAVKGNTMKMINTRSGITSRKQKYNDDALYNFYSITRERMEEEGIDVKSLERFW